MSVSNPETPPPGPSALFQPTASYPRPIRRIVVLHRGVSPTTDIYIRARLKHAACPVTYEDIRTRPPGAAFDDGTFVVLVRYLNPPWAWALWRARRWLSGVAYLVDDDIPQARHDPSLPRDYARKVSLFWILFRPFLARVVSEVWVTSSGLQQAYGGPRVHRMDPLYIGPTSKRASNRAPGPPEQPVRIFYHGGRTHAADQAWLNAVIAQVQARRDNTVFEIFGDAATARLYADIPRCRVVHRRAWSDYLTYASGERLDIGLAPAVAGAYNAARSFNKAYDITRAGGAGIYADVPSFREFVTHDQEGLLVAADEPTAWVEAILALVDDPGRRRRLHAAALDRCQAIHDREIASPLIARFQRAADDPGRSDVGG